MRCTAFGTSADSGCQGERLPLSPVTEESTARHASHLHHPHPHPPRPPAHQRARLTPLRFRLRLCECPQTARSPPAARRDNHESPRAALFPRALFFDGISSSARRASRPLPRATHRRHCYHGRLIPALIREQVPEGLPRPRSLRHQDPSQ